MIVDAFIFYNELKMLEYRLNILYEKIDYFILVESTKTHKGSPKKLYFNDNKDNFKKYLDKIIHIIVDDMPDGNNHLLRENHQRNCIKRGINKLKLNDKDLIIISDVDEIPNLNKINNINIDKVNSLESIQYYYNLNCAGHYSSKICSKVLSFKLLNKYTCQEVRKISQNNISRAGWHLSFFGDITFIKNKLSEYLHCNDNIVLEILNSSNPEKKIEERIKNSSDLFLGRNNNFKFIDIKNNKDLPPNYTFFI